jgi:hypothetical protein
MPVRLIGWEIRQLVTHVSLAHTIFWQCHMIYQYIPVAVLTTSKQVLNLEIFILFQMDLNCIMVQCGLVYFS